MFFPNRSQGNVNACQCQRGKGGWVWSAAKPTYQTASLPDGSCLEFIQPAFKGNLQRTLRQSLAWKALTALDRKEVLGPLTDTDRARLCLCTWDVTEHCRSGSPRQRLWGLHRKLHYIDRWHRWQSLSCVCGCGWQQNSLFFTVCMWRLILSFSCRNCLLFLILGGVPAHILSWTSYFCSDKKFPNKHYCALQIPKPALNQLLVESYMLTLGKDLAITCSDVSPK